jgi:hypothetical protein
VSAPNKETPVALKARGFLRFGRYLISAAISHSDSFRWCTVIPRCPTTRATVAACQSDRLPKPKPKSKTLSSEQAHLDPIIVHLSKLYGALLAGWLALGIRGQCVWFLATGGHLLRLATLSINRRSVPFR